MNRLLPILAAGLFAALPAPAPAAADVTLAFGATPYALAASCDLTQPLLSVNVKVRNHGTTALAAQAIEAVDQSGVLRGSVSIAPLAAGAKVLISVPMRSPGMNPAAIAGAHTVMVSAGQARSAPLLVQIPPAFCAPPAPKAAPAGPTAVTSSGTISARAHPLAPGGAGPVHPVLVQNAPARGAAIVAALKVGAPNNVRAAIGGPDCAAHVGLLGALVCPDMIKSGDLLLVWDWQAGAGPDDIDGYRVYRVDSGLKQLVYTRANKKALTLVDVAKPSGGYAGKCYAVSAYLAKRESDLSPAFCSGGSSAATTTKLSAIHTRSTYRQRDNTMFTSPGHSGMNVGFNYSKEEHLLGDDFHNYIYRTAIAFDVSALQNRRLVSAKLYLTIVTSAGAGNNHSCATDVGTGTEFWWQNGNGPWLEAQFGYNIAPTDTGPVISADVTPIVAPWLRGEPNYGFVLKNADENLNAFIDKQCETQYGSPALELTYY